MNPAGNMLTRRLRVVRACRPGSWQNLVDVTLAESDMGRDQRGPRPEPPLRKRIALP